MEPLRLDPADPLGSVLRWLAALARALGLEPAALIGPLPRPAASMVRAWLADWSRQLRTLIRLEAARLARRLQLALPLKRRAADYSRRRATRAAAPRTAPRGRLAAVGSSLRGLRAPRGAMRPAVRPQIDAALDPAEEAALRRRARAVLAALEDPSAATLRLARRLARRRARAEAAAPWRRSRPPRPPLVLGAGLRGRAPTPEPRPPDASAPVC
jgi:hypothetical protein